MKGTYPASPSGDFTVVDVVGVPHPYCLGTQHVAYAADHCGGILNERAIEDAEKAGARCDICKGKLSYKEHLHALLVNCKIDVYGNKVKKEELEAWLKSIADEAKKNGYAGFAFKRGW